MATGVSERGYYLGTSSRPPDRFVTRYTGPPNGDLSEIRAFTAPLGIACEEAALRAWTGKMAISNKLCQELSRSSDLVRKKVEESYLKLRGERDKKGALKDGIVDNAYVEVAGYDETLSYPKSPLLASLFCAAGQVSNVSFRQLYSQLPVVSGEVSPMVRYLVDAALIIASLGIDSISPFSGARIIPGVSIPSLGNGVMLVKPDGILVSSKRFWGKLPVGETWNLFRYLRRFVDQPTAPWGLLEIKSIFKKRLHASEIKTPPRLYLDQLRHQLGMAILLWKEEGIGLLPLPVSLNLVLLRSHPPHDVFSITPNHWFLSNWILGLEKFRDRLDHQAEDYPKLEALLALLHLYVARTPKVLEGQVNRVDRSPIVPVLLDEKPEQPLLGSILKDVETDHTHSFMLNVGGNANDFMGYMLKALFELKADKLRVLPRDIDVAYRLESFVYELGHTGRRSEDFPHSIKFYSAKLIEASGGITFQISTRSFLVQLANQVKEYFQTHPRSSNDIGPWKSFVRVLNNLAGLYESQEISITGWEDDHKAISPTSFSLVAQEVKST